VTGTPSRRSAAFALAALTVINLLNYLDRYVVAGVMTRLQAAFGLNDEQGGLLATTFMIVYLLASPVAGYLGDRLPRQRLIGGAVLLWSLATVGSGLANGFALLLVARALTGVGEAGYGTVSPSFISDLFPPAQRGRALALFYSAMPLGAAAGFVLGGALGRYAGWQAPFFVGGVPGLVLGALAFLIPEPARGGMETTASAKVPFAVGLRALARNARFWVVTGGLTLMTFSIGGLAFWMPKFLEFERGFTATDAGLTLGATTVLGGVLGTLCGGFLGDRLDRWRAGGGVLLSGVGLTLAAPLMVASVHLTSRSGLTACLLMAQFFIFLNNGPLNAAIVNVVSPGFRAFAFSVATLTLHLLGDALSPWLIGRISDASSLGHAITLNAVPVLLGGLLLLAGTRSFRNHRY
jgi:predicted MFS family arabinose efflux permease